MKFIKKNGAITSGLAVTAFIAALIIFALLLYTEKKVIASEEKISVCVATSEIPDGTEINILNYKEYFSMHDIYISAVPDGALTSIEALYDKTAEYSITEGTVITDGMFRMSNIGSRGMNNPVLVGFKVEDIYQAVGGILRSGDYVHIYVVDEDGEAVLRWRNVCIEYAFDNSGNILARTDEGKAMRFDAFFEMRDVKEFYEYLDSGKIRIVLKH